MQNTKKEVLNFINQKYSIIFTEEQIQLRIKELAQQILNDYNDEEIILVGVLKGSFMFLSDLCRHLGPKVIVEFMQVSSYGVDTKSSGNIRVIKDVDINIKDKNVLIVEDIIESGLTLNYIKDLFKTRRPKTLKAVAMLSKPDCHDPGYQLEYLGFDISSKFVVGYGLDYVEYCRNLPYIVQIDSDNK